MVKRVKREDLVYEVDDYTYNSQKYEVIGSVTKNMFDGKITLYNADKDQHDLLFYFIDFNK